jgi:transcription-repair coupling factor (superfamily II helicase)
MQLTGLLDLLRESTAYRDLIARLQTGASVPDLSVIRAARPFVLGALAGDWHGPVVYITARVDRAYNVSEQLPVWVGEKMVYRFSEPTPLFYERAPWGETVIRNRLATLAALAPPDDAILETPIVVTSARAIMQRTLPVNQFRKGSMRLEIRQRHNVARLLERWLALGYEPVPIVVEAGTFSRRGGVLDVFPPAVDRPIRIEFFDDEIESLRQFDPSTQRSAGQLQHAVITPAREALPEHAPPVAEHLKAWFKTLGQVNGDATNPMADAEPLANATAFGYLEHYLPYLYPQPVSLLDYAPDNALVVVEDWGELRDTIAEIEENAIRTRGEKLASNLLATDQPLPYVTWDALAEELESRKVVRLGYSTEGENATQVGDLSQLFAPEQHFGGQLKNLLNHLRGLRKADDRIVVVT